MPALSAASLHFQKVGHVAGERAHVLHAFQILHHVLGVCAMDAVPVAGADDGHLAQGKVPVQLIYGCCCARTPGTGETFFCRSGRD